MPRVTSRRSDISEVEPDGLAEQELVKLQQQYRIMEGDRKAYSEESQNIIRRQRSAIKALQEENEELMKDNRLAGSTQNITKDKVNVDSLGELMHVEEELKRKGQEDRSAITKLDAEIHSMERKINLQRKNMGGVHMSHAKQVMIKKQTRVLENRLDQANKKFNDGLAENSKLREQIDHMRTEREIFDGLYKKLEKQLNDNKQEIAEIIEASTSAYDARDDAQAKMMALKEKSDKDLAQYNMELKELMRIIDHDRKLKEFMGIKSEDRSDVDGLPQSRKSHEREKLGEKEDTIESYEAAFEKIKATTGIADIDMLVDIFIQTEDKNFALFNYVNELNNDIEMLQEQIIGIEEDIEKFKKESVELEEQRKEILKQLEAKHEEATNEADDYDKKYKATNKILEQLKAGIDSLFSKISCDPAPITGMLGGHAGVAEANMMQYLGIIEQRTNELLQVQAFIATKEDERAQAIEGVGLLGKGPQQAASTVAVQLPSTGDDYESDASAPSDDESRPLTQAELKAKIMKGITKREASGPKKMHSTSASMENINEEKTPTRRKKGAR